MSKFTEMGKVELRAACKTVGIKGYGNMTNDGMRAALEVHSPVPAVTAKDVATQVVTAEKGLTADEAAAKIARVTKVLTREELGISMPGAIEKGAASELKTTKAKKVKAERKVRASANGVTQPSSGTICGAIWAALDAKRIALKGETPTFEHLRELAKDAGWQKNTAMTQYQRWKQFNGLMPRSLTV